MDDTPVHAGLRESLANSLIHADYHGRRGIVIDKEFRKVTISNPGTFRVSIEEAIAGGVSDARNGKIFNMFALIDVGERSGSGLCDIYSVWQENGFKSPEITETVNPDRITLTLQLEVDVNPDETASNDVVCDVNPHKTASNDTVSDVNDVVLLAEKERQILLYFAGHSTATIKDVSTALGIGRATIDRSIRILKEKGLLSRQGTTRKPIWAITDKMEL